MKLLKAATTFCLVALVAASLTTAVKADVWNKKTSVTFSGPVEIPGVHLAGWGVLPAGTYVFKLMDSNSDRHIVQIFSQDEKTLYATILAIPNYRLKPTDNTVITFRERPAGQPEAIRAWFYPGSSWGEEFVYGKSKAIELAKSSTSPVLFMPVETVEVAEVTEIDAPVVVQMKSAPIMAIKSSGDEVAMLEVVTLPPSRTEPAALLPKTASELPLTGMLGLFLLGAAITVGTLAKRMQS